LRRRLVDGAGHPSGVPDTRRAHTEQDKREAPLFFGCSCRCSRTRLSRQPARGRPSLSGVRQVVAVGAAWGRASRVGAQWLTSKHPRGPTSTRSPTISATSPKGGLGMLLESCAACQPTTGWWPTIIVTDLLDWVGLPVVLCSPACRRGWMMPAAVRGVIRRGAGRGVWLAASHTRRAGGARGTPNVPAAGGGGGCRAAAVPGGALSRGGGTTGGGGGRLLGAWINKKEEQRRAFRRACQPMMLRAATPTPIHHDARA